MSNTFNIKRYNALTDTVVEEQITDQPEFRVSLKDNNGELLVDEYTTNNYLNAQSFPVVQQPVMYDLYMDSVCYDMVNTFPRIVAGHMLSLFRDRSTFRFFDIPTEEVNKVKLSIHIGELLNAIIDAGGTYTGNKNLIYETKSQKVWVSDVNYDASPYTFKEYNENTHEWDITRINNYLINYVEVTICPKDKDGNLLNNYATRINVTPNYPFSSGQAFSACVENCLLVCTIMILDNFNPKYTATGYTYSRMFYLDNYNDASSRQIEYGDSSISFSDTVGKIAIPVFTLVPIDSCVTLDSSNHIYGLSQFEVLVDTDYEPWAARVFEDFFDHTYGFIPQGKYYPYNYRDIKYTNAYGNTIVSSQNMPYFGDGAFTTPWFIPAMYDETQEAYMMFSAIVDYEEPGPGPGPGPEPDPGEDPKNYEPGINVPEVEDPGETPPTPEPPKKDDLYDRLTEYIDGKLGQDNIEEEEQTPSDEVQPYDGRTEITTISALGSNWSIYFGNLDTIASLRDDITDLAESAWDKACLILDSSFSPSNVISKVLQFPYSTTYIVNQLNSVGSPIEMACPCHKNIPLCADPGVVGSFDDYKRLVTSRFGVMDGEVNSSTVFKSLFDMLTGITGNPFSSLRIATRFSPILQSCNTYPRIQNRLVPIHFGSKTIKRIFGNYIDFTEVNYRMLLPTGVLINLDPQLLFRNSDGSESNECVLNVEGMLDLETGDVLITITANDDMISQTTVNVAIERSLYGNDNVQAMRAIVSALGDVVKAIALRQFPATRIDEDPGQTWTRKTGDVKVWDDKGNVKFTQKAGDSSSTRSAATKTTTYYPSQEQSAELAVNGILKQATAWQGSPTISLSEFNSQGSTKIISNQLPILIYDYPEIVMPHRKTNSYSSKWDFNFNYQDEYGLPACTYNVGVGYNRYNSISKIDFTWSYSWAYDEYEGFANSLLDGFYVLHNNYIHVEPKAYDDLFKKHLHDAEPGKGAYLGPEVTNWISLFSTSGVYAKYIDKYFHIAYHEANNWDFWDCYKCQIYRDQDITAPIIDIDQKIYYHQNSAQWCGRFYKVNKVEYLTGHIVRLYLKEDFLSSWFWAARVVGLIDRSSAYGINNMQDNIPHTTKRITKKIIYDDMQSNLGISLAALSANPYMTKAEILDRFPDMRVQERDTDHVSPHSGSHGNF